MGIRNGQVISRTSARDLLPVSLGPPCNRSQRRDLRYRTESVQYFSFLMFISTMASLCTTERTPALNETRRGAWHCPLAGTTEGMEKSYRPWQLKLAGQ